MTVRGKLGIAALLPVLMAIIISGVLSWMSNLVYTVGVITKTSDQIVKRIFELNQATDDYAHIGGEEARKTWTARCRALEEALSVTPPALPLVSVQTGSSAPLVAMRSDLTHIRTAFTELVELRARQVTPDEKATSEAILKIRMSNSSQSMIIGASTLADVARVRASELQGNACLFLALAAIALAIPLAILALTVSGTVTRAIAALREGTQVVSSGDFQHRIHMPPGDELVDLAGAFNKMTASITVSHDDLRKEMEEHKKTAEVLRESNRQLSDVLIKLKRAQDQSIEQERMQALRQVAHGIVHDFNSSLTPVLGTTEYILSSPEMLKDPKEMEESIRMIDEAAKASRDLVRNLAEFFRPSTATLVDFVDLNQIVLETIDLTRPRWKEQAEADGRKISIVKDLSPTPVTTHGNRVEITEAITNLFLNAIDSLGSSGSVTFRTRLDMDTVILEIQDNGEGMPPEVRARCFEPFFSTKGSEFTGMGLSTARGIVTRHKGNLELDSEPGKGTLVTIRMPYQHDPPLMAPVALEEKPMARGLSILVVDDEIWSRKIIAKYLGADGCKTELACNATEALALFKAGTFDAVVLDRAMPDMNGDQLAAELRKLSPKMPIVMLTGFGNIMEERGEHPAAVDVVIGKPFTKKALRSALTGLLKKPRA